MTFQEFRWGNHFLLSPADLFQSQWDSFLCLFPRQAKSDFDYNLDPMGSFGLDIEEPNPSEIGMENGKRFKLYEKKRLTHEKAKKFCKKREGQLAQGELMHSCYIFCCRYLISSKLDRTISSDDFPSHQTLMLINYEYFNFSDSDHWVNMQY